ncbi:MAG: helical backbone metal receptor [Planctomycetota bacterium]|jgi:ABC-type Fe3+-hydroxamate transport system substrate-binding protein
MVEAVRRVVSLVPSLTETVCDLGVGCRLVGVSQYCAEPEEILRFIPRVGGTKNPDREKIASLEPDLILMNREENRAEDLAWFESRFQVHASMPCSVPDAAAVVRDLGKLFDVEEEAEAILLEIEALMTRSEVEGLDLNGVRVFYPIWKQPWIGVNKNTYVHDVLARSGAINVCANREARYPVVAEQGVPGLEVDVVLLPSEPFLFTLEHRRELLRSQYFGKGVPVLLVDGKDFCWHGSRSGRGLSQVTDLLKPFR